MGAPRMGLRARDLYWDYALSGGETVKALREVAAGV